MKGENLNIFKRNECGSEGMNRKSMTAMLLPARPTGTYLYRILCITVLLRIRYVPSVSSMGGAATGVQDFVFIYLRHANPARPCRKAGRHPLCPPTILVLAASLMRGRMPTSGSNRLKRSPRGRGRQTRSSAAKPKSPSSVSCFMPPSPWQFVYASKFSY